MALVAVVFVLIAMFWVVRSLSANGGVKGSGQGSDDTSYLLNATDASAPDDSHQHHSGDSGHPSHSHDHFPSHSDGPSHHGDLGGFGSGSSDSGGHSHH